MQTEYDLRMPGYGVFSDDEAELEAFTVQICLESQAVHMTLQVCPVPSDWLWWCLFNHLASDE